MHRPPLRRTIAIGVCCTALAVVLVSSRRGFAVCNVIPGTTQTFRASQTTVDRPFASPRDFVELGLDPTCYPIARTFSATPGDQVVTVVFTPPGAGPRNVVVGAEQEWMAVQEVPVDADDAWVQVAYPVLHPHHHPNHRAVFVVFLYRYS